MGKLLLPKRGLVLPSRRRFLAGAAAFVVAAPAIVRAQSLMMTGAGADGSAGGGGWTNPLDASHTPAFWFDATDNATITLSGSDMTDWADKSGNSRTLSYASGVHWVKAAAQINALQALRNLGAIYATSSFGITQPFLIMAAIQTDTAIGAFGALLGDSTGTHNIILLRHNSFSDLAWIRADPTGTPPGFTISTSPLSVSTPYQIYAVFNGSSSSGKVTGQTAQTGDAGPDNFTGGLNMGVTGLGTNYYVGEVFAIPNYTAADITNGGNYLQSRWGVAQ